MDTTHGPLAEVDWLSEWLPAVEFEETKRAADEWRDTWMLKWHPGDPVRFTEHVAPHQAACLRVLYDAAWRDDVFNVRSFLSLQRETGLTRVQVKRAVRRLAGAGLAEYHRGCWTEDGQVAGSGYSITKKGKSIVVEVPLCPST